MGDRSNPAPIDAAACWWAFAAGAPESVVVVDAEDRLVWFNRTVRGHDPAQMMGEDVGDYSHPDHREALRAVLRRVREQGVAQTLSMQAAGPDGTTSWYESRYTPLGGGRVLIVAKDVTDRYRDVEALRESRQFLADAQALARMGSWTWNLGPGDRLVWSDEVLNIFGLTREGFDGDIETFFALVHPDDVVAVRAACEAAIAERDTYAVEHRIMRSDGSIRWVHARGSVVCDKSGQPLRMIGVVQDVTERREVEARLLLADRMASVGMIAAAVAHEINNPIAFVSANLEVARRELAALRDAGGLPADRSTALLSAIDDCLGGAARISHIVRELRPFARVDEEPRLVPVDVRQVLRSALEMAQNEIRHRARVVKVTGEVPPVLGSEPRLAQVFLNVLVNAAQAIPEGAAADNEVRVTTRCDERGWAIVEVEDTGPGIPEVLLGRVLDPFFTTKPAGVGTGLGLAICHRIVTELGGTIEITNREEGGCRVRVALPPTQAPAAPPVVKTAPPPLVGRARLLVVDDEVFVTTAVARIFAAHEVVTLSSALCAVERLLSGERFDVVLCDLMMPDMTGMEMHAILARERPALLGSLVFMTGGAFTPGAASFLARRDVRSIEKPFRMDELKAVVRDVVACGGHHG